jgi:hypothetical protein
MASFNGYARLDQTPLTRPVTLPRFSLKEPDIEAKAREAAARVAEKKVIRRGRECWEAIGRTGSYENWLAESAALAIGKAHALRVTGANQAWGPTLFLRIRKRDDRTFTSTRIGATAMTTIFELRFLLSLPQRDRYRVRSDGNSCRRTSRRPNSFLTVQSYQETSYPHVVRQTASIGR